VADGWDEVRLPVGDPSSLAQELAGYGPDVVALEPPDVREDVIRKLRAALEAQSPDQPLDLSRADHQAHHEQRAGA
jgi:predicted DNA-binding transcriptional regulator YafY